VVRSPELFSDVTLIGVHPGLSSSKERAERLQSDEQWSDLLIKHGIAEFEAKWSALPLFETQTALSPREQGALREIRLSHTSAGLAHAFRSLGLGAMPNFWPDLPHIRTQLNWIVGERDEKFVALAAQAQAALPQLTVHKVPNVGHNVVLEAPEWLTRALFLLQS
jgi:2-succinyl-6-hydroxy-2,4-cyclohexadiene-1-carboxylate synthase